MAKLRTAQNHATFATGLLESDDPMKYFMFSFVLLVCFLQQHAYAAEHTLIYDGEDRRFFVHTPPSASTSTHRLPVIMIMHGGGGSAEGFAAQTSFNETADKYGFLAVYPEGVGSRRGNFHTWNAGRCCGRAANENIDDTGFLSTVIDILAAQYNADPRRVYMTGHSNGAMMSYRFACKYPNKVAAIAPNGGAFAFDDCDSSRFVPILHFHGTEDQCARYAGGEQCGGCFNEMLGPLARFAPLTKNSGSCDPIPETLSRWAAYNGCSAKTSVTLKKGNAECVSWKDCKAPVTLCSLHGAGHTWPGGRYSLPMCANDQSNRQCQRLINIVGPINHDISANEVMWSFFKQHHL